MTRGKLKGGKGTLGEGFVKRSDGVYELKKK